MHREQTTFENIVSKGEIAHNEQLLLLSQCFQLNYIFSLFIHRIIAVSYTKRFQSRLPQTFYTVEKRVNVIKGKD